jgi:D-glycero-D-manno-heptose 1,7-bisphosphate phosphatase
LIWKAEDNAVCAAGPRRSQQLYHGDTEYVTKTSSSADINQDRLRHLRTVFLDRDGVLNEKMPEGQYVTCREEFRLLPGVAEAIRHLNHSGLTVILVSNQRGIALGLYTAADVDAIHAWLRTILESHGAHLDGIFYCPHDKGDCDCRKPMPGLFQQAVMNFPEIDAHSSMIIGDSLSDIEFGRRLGMMSILIEGDPTRRKPGTEEARRLADFTCPSLAEAVDLLLDARALRTSL